MENGLAAKLLSVEGLAKLSAYRWPGNVRELQNVIERSVLLGSGQEIGALQILLPDEATTESPPSFSPGLTVGEAERMLIEKTLEFTRQNRTRAAEMLGISIRTLRNKLNEYRGDGSHETDFR